ncbi:PQQ-like beta-propeller repeat protein [Planctomycetes bacterium K23_9]|uniref:Serine/threonine-protein kinase AfsK n=1 Tax=Stieleria marina TaxID=1930275 RepID=A0A517NU25_9BACT|nr:Serine/threonine-protein kinase AfsK [Planctomycetes bacterium K23_9]
MKLSLKCCLFLACLFAVVTTANADWPAYLHGNTRAGFSDQTLDPSLKLAWTYTAPAKPEKAWSGPREAAIEGHEMKHRVDFDDCFQVVAADGRVFFGDSVDHQLHCVDAKTGKPLWTFYTDGPIRLAPTLAFGNVYFGSDDGKVYCLNAADGKVVWQMRVSGKDDRLISRGEMISRWPVRTGVLIDGDIAYFGAGVFPHETIYLCAVNARDGKVIWKNDMISQQDAGRNDLSPQGYLLSNKDNLFVPSGRSLPVAVSKKTGKIIFQRTHSWRTDAGGVVGGTKAVLGDGQVYSGGAHHFLAMDENSGDVGEAWINGRQMVLADEFAYLLDGEKIFCVNRAEHAKASQEKQKWFLKAREWRKEPKKVKQAKQKMKEYMGVGIQWQHESSFDDALIATASTVIAGGLNEFVVLDRKTGKELWKHDVVGNVRGLAFDDGLLTVSTDAGRIYGFRRDAGEPATWPSPAVNAFADADKFYANAAQEIIRESNQSKGYALLLGCESGELAYQLAIQSELNVFVVEPDRATAERARANLQTTGLHATRVTVVQAPLDLIPFSNYFANLIVSESMLRTGRLPCKADSISRFLKPCGGVAIVGQSSDATPGEQAASQTEMQSWLTALYQTDEGEVTSKSPWHFVRRGKLAGAGDWSHQYGNAANTSYADDHRIRDGLGVLWYGDPGPSAMINRHEASGAPLSTNGRMFIQGTDRLMAYDAYNGTFLWDYANPGAIRTGVFNNRETHNLAASDDALFVAVDNQCTALDAATGKAIATYTTPESPDGIERAWAYLAYDSGQVFGTSTIRQELDRRLRRRGLTVKSQTDAIFAVDVASGKRIWTYRGDNILHTTIAIGPEHVYFIDSSITPEERQQLYLKDKGDLKDLSGEAAKKAEAEMKAYDVRLAVALDRRTGEKLWEKPVNVTDTTNVSSGGGSLTLMYADDHVVLCGANANGHYWKQFLSGQFEKRKLLVLDAQDGAELWSRNANYMNRPAIVGSDIYAEPWAFDLHTGQPKTRPHPLTGEDSQWRFSRPGHHCGVITATPNMMFFRSGFIGYYDLYQDSGTRHFAGQRLGCWVNAIPGNGLVMIPEATAGCVCQFSIASTVVMEPKTQNKSWGIFSAVGPTTPVKRIGINLGAPGDRKDISGNEWLGYPRPSSRKRLEFELDLEPKLESGGGWYSRNPDSVTIDGTDKPWVYASGAKGLQSLVIPLLGSKDDACDYTVKLHFANLDASDTAAFDIRVQDDVVGKAVVVAGSDKASVDPQVLTFENVPVTDNLVVTLNPSDPERLPTIAAIEVIRQD